MKFSAEIVAAIKRKKELSSLEDNYVLKKTKKVLPEKKKWTNKLEKAKSFSEFSRSKEFKEIRSAVREELRKVYGVFQVGKQKAGKKAAKRASATAKKTKSGKKVEAAAVKHLSAHKSSLERLPYYPTIYEEVFKLTGEPRALLDLGCGANPFSYEYLNCKPLYVAIDLPSAAMNEIQHYFEKKKIFGYTYGIDLVAEPERLKQINHVDVAFLFKLLDSLETIKKNISRKLLESINADWLVVSFPTISIGGKKRIQKERRAWFEKLLQRKRWEYDVLEIGDEIFYVIKKRKNVRRP